MEKLLMCRICLTTDIRSGSILKPHLQDTYEKLTAEKFETKDSRPILACCLCCARLQNCYQLSMNCLRSEELLTQIISGKMLNPGNLQNITRKIRLGITPVVVETFGDSHHFDLDASGKSSSEFEGVDVEMKVVVNQVLEENVPEEKIKEEPVLEDAFKYVEAEDEIPLDIVKHEIGTFPSGNIPKKPAKAMRGNPEDSTSSNLKETEHTKVKIEERKENYEKITVVFKTVAKTGILEKKDMRKGKYTSDIGLKPHINSLNSNRGNKPHTCGTCQKSFRYRRTLNRHTLCHAIAYNNFFFFKRDLIRTFNTRFSRKPIQCDVCMKYFVDSTHLNDHIRKHTQIMYYV